MESPSSRLLLSIFTPTPINPCLRGQCRLLLSLLELYLSLLKHLRPFNAYNYKNTGESVERKARVREIVGSNPARVKPMTSKLILVTS